MSSLRNWLNRHPLGLPYRWTRDLLRLSTNRRETAAQLDELRSRLERETAANTLLREQLLTVQRSQLLSGDRFVALERRGDSLEERAAGLEAVVREQAAELRDQAAGQDALSGRLNGHEAELSWLAPIYRHRELPFSHAQPAPDWIANAEAVIGQRLADIPLAEREHWFYSFYSEMAGGVGHILRLQYEHYLPYLPQLPGLRVLDIGCGAGEFLKFLQEHGRLALGLDLDASEVERAGAAGLEAIQGDAVAFLPASSERFAAITLFQVIEHIPPAQLRPLVAACVDALAPGGALLMETVNLRHPGALNGFYTDPTHQIPISDTYLSFLFRWYGLERVELVYTLPEWQLGLNQDDAPRCYANYTVIGYKAP